MLCSDYSAEDQIRHGPQHTVKPKEQRAGAQMEGATVGRHSNTGHRLEGQAAWLRHSVGEGIQ